MHALASTPVFKIKETWSAARIMPQIGHSINMTNR
jgi:hypothetical protein